VQEIIHTLHITIGIDAQPSNMRLKLAAPVDCGKIAFVNVQAWCRSLGAPR